MARQRKKKGVSFFWCFYLVFVILLIAFWAYAAHYVKKCLVRYEECLPEHKMDEVLVTLQQNGLEEYLSIEGEISRFEDEKDYVDDFCRDMKGRILFYTKSRDYSDKAPKYDLYADGELVGAVSLKERTSERLIMILTVSTWDLESVEVKRAAGSETVRITVPLDYKIFVNGRELDERERTGEAVTPAEFDYASEYVSVPQIVTYEIRGLLKHPQIEMYDRFGDAVEIGADQDPKNISITEFRESEMPQDLKKMALENAKRYTNFFSTDLPGCKASVAPIADMFPEGSYYLQLADTYRREDMWTYSGHETPIFYDERVDHYIRYNEDLFSCEVYFKKEMKLLKMNYRKVDVNYSKVYYGRLNGEWKILDIKTLVEAQDE